MLEKDQAAHGFNGKRTPKVESLYKLGGTIYAHVMHTHLLINFVTQLEGVPEGVLIRAVEPEENIEAMRLNRNKDGFELTNGPGKWTKAFNIPRHLDGSRLNEGHLKIDTKTVNTLNISRKHRELVSPIKVNGHKTTSFYR